MNEGCLINRETRQRHSLVGVTIIGRSADCGVAVPDPAVSRRHAMIRQQEDGFWFFDLGSFNGSYINDRRVVASERLKQGDRLSISGHEFDFEESGGRLVQSDGIAGDSTMAQVRTSNVILLVTDVRGFTRMSEKLEPDVLAPIIGSWYSFTERILAEHGATLDKFIGDCALAYWTNTSEDSRRKALRAAAAMRQSCHDTFESHRRVLEGKGLGFEVCAGIHIGRVAYGGMSSREFTLVGDAVNVTFRVEALTRSLNEPVLVTADFLRGWDEGISCCRSLGHQMIKGRSEPVEVFGV